MNDTADTDPRLYAIPDIHGHAKGEHKAFIDERPIPLSARMLFLWFFHACRRGWPRFLMVSDHMNYLTFEDPAAINLVRRALKLAQAGDLHGAAETASVEVGHAAVVSEGLRRGMRYSIGAEVDNDPRSRPDAQNIVDAMKPDGMIRSVHFLTIDHPTHGPGWNWPFDNPEFADVHDLVGTAKTWEVYMTTVLDAVERLPGNILGHFYVPALFGHWPDDTILDGYENQLVDACEARGMAIEFNTRFLYRHHSDDEKAKYLAVHRRLLAKCKARNVGIAIGSDAHSPKDQGRAFQAVLALLDECGINELVFPIAGRLARVALRVERKIEPVPEPPAPALEERKVARKARPSETSAHADTSIAAVAATGETIAPSRAKPARPKRSKAKPAQESAVLSDATVVEPADPASAEATVVEATVVEATGIEANVVEAGVVEVTVVEATVVEEGAVVEAPADAQETAVPAAAAALGNSPDAEPAIIDAIAESLVSDAVEDMVSEPAFEPIVSARDAEPIAADPQPAPATDPLAQIEEETIALVTDPEPEDAGSERAPAPANPRDAGEERSAVHKPRPRPASVKAKATSSKAKSPVAKSNSAAKRTVKPSAAKITAKKAPAKKAPSSAKKAGSAKQSEPAKPAAKKTPAKKAGARPASGKKAAAKKTGAKKSPAKKTAPRRR